jgi:hypothetical protein
MMRLLAAIVLASTLLVAGCSSPQLMLPPGEDSTNLVEKIAEKGNGGSPAPSENDQTAGPPVIDRVSTAVAKGVVTTVKVAETAGLVVLVSAYLVAFAQRSAEEQPFHGNGISKAFENIWSN